ncbi:hypothetical protein LUZ60_009008 [Juncus effusus]|nr:hypothetical protein LUZ60_009008 [Juncus effusus]
MSVWGEMNWTGGGGGRKPAPAKRPSGGMAEALSIASDLGFSIPTPQEDESNFDKGDDLVKVLRELTSVQRNLANLQVELQGRKDDKNIAHLTHVSEMEKKCESLARITSILKDVIHNKDRIIARLQQPYSIDCIPVEAEYQKQFSELLLKAASDYEALTSSVSDFQWSQKFSEPPSVWGELLRPIPSALSSCTRFFEAMFAMRESFQTLQQIRVGSSDSSSANEARTPGGLADDQSYLSPEGFRIEGFSEGKEKEREEVIDHRRLSWPKRGI